MSTKKIREALSSQGLTHDVSEALAEVEAIEKAARVVVTEGALEDWNSAMPAELASGIKTIQTIARGSGQ